MAYREQARGTGGGRGRGWVQRSWPPRARAGSRDPPGRRGRRRGRDALPGGAASSATAGELHVHCYRMLGSFHESEDLVQETFLRAWRRRETFEGRSSLRAWLYKIATNACLDALDKRPRAGVAVRRGAVAQAVTRTRLLAELGSPTSPSREAAVCPKETIELAFLVAIQRLAAVAACRVDRPRRARLLRGDTAMLLETSVPAVNSALQRAHTAMKEHLPRGGTTWCGGRRAHRRRTRAPRPLHRAIPRTRTRPRQGAAARGRPLLDAAPAAGGLHSEGRGSRSCRPARRAAVGWGRTSGRSAA